jgi:Domain of unknown function (DUF4388)
MLQGTFETLSLPEVLGLLASARKSGALWVDAGPITGVVHVADGHCHAVEAGDLRNPVDGAPDLLIRLVDVCFAVMCQESGSFRFAADDPAPWWCAEPVELSDALVEVDRLLKQWREILRVIPSLECRPRLLDALEVDEIIVDRERWALLVAIDGRRTVRELVQRAGGPVIDVCHVLLELVEAGAIGVIDPAASRPVEVEAEVVVEVQVESPPVERPPEMVQAEAPPPEIVQPEPEPVPVPVPEPVLVEPVLVEPVPAEAAHEAMVSSAATVLGAGAESVPGGGDAPDKGAFLRLFSGLRES